MMALIKKYKSQNMNLDKDVLFLRAPTKSRVKIFAHCRICSLKKGVEELFNILLRHLIVHKTLIAFFNNKFKI